MTVLRPFFTFYGGKWAAAPHYPRPVYDTIIEPFAGSAGYALRYYDRQVILVERDPHVAATWRYLLRVKPAEILDLPDIESGQTVDDLQICQEARLLVGWWLNRGANRPNKSPGKWMRQRVRPASFWGQHVRERIAAQVNAIRHWQLVEGDYTRAPNVRATWFVDPPYEHAGRHYRFGSRLLDFARLGQWCRYLPGQVIACENVGADWLPFEPCHAWQTGTIRGGKTNREALWHRQ